MSRILCANYFGTGELGRTYRRLAHVLAYTAAQHCPGWDVRIQHHTTLMGYASALGNPSHAYNAENLHIWNTVIQEAADGDEVLFLDADTMIVNALDPVWEAPFDVAYTVRVKGAIPLNAGVVCARVSDRTRRFFARWAETCLFFLRNPNPHRPWRLKYRGINQSSLGALLEAGDHGCQIAPLSCLEWNCENTEWASFDPTVTRIVHLKSGLRRALFSAVPSPKYTRLVSLWRHLEAEVGPNEYATPAPSAVIASPRRGVRVVRIA